MGTLIALRQRAPETSGEAASRDLGCAMRDMVHATWDVWWLAAVNVVVSEGGERGA